MEIIKSGSGMQTSILRGKRVLLLGGDPRSHQQKAIENQLELDQLKWFGTRKSTALGRLQRIVANETCDCVVLALRWASHSYSEVALICRHRGIPFLRLPGGISPAQIAHQAGMQISHRLQTKS